MAVINVYAPNDLILGNSSRAAESTPASNLFKKKFTQSESYTPSTWTRFKEIFKQPSPLHQSIRSMAYSKKIKGHLNREQKELVQEALQSNEFPKLQAYLATIFNKLSPIQVQNLLENVFTRSCEESSTAGQKSDPIQIMHNLGRLLSLKKIEAAAHVKLDEFTTGRESALDMAKIVGGHFTMEAEEKRKSTRQRVTLYVVHIIEKAIRFTLLFLNLKNLFEEPDSPWELMYKLQILTGLWAGLSSVLTAISLFVGSSYLAALIAGSGAIALTILAVSYTKLLMPCPEQIPHCENYTNAAVKGEFEPVLARDAYIDTLIHILGSNLKGTRSHPLLVGPSGVGKTEIVKGLAQRIASGNVPEFLKDKKVFYINTSDMAKSGPFGVSVLSEIQNAIKGHEHDAIFFFDEIHMAWKGEGELGDQLKTLLDPGPGGFPYVIGATTVEEYKEFIAGRSAFERRFEMMRIDETNEDQTALILNNQLYREAPNIYASDSILKAIYQAAKKEFPKASQPSKAKKILGKAISQIRSVQDQKITQALQALKDRRTYISCSYMRSKGDRLLLDSKEGRALKEEMAILDKEIAEKEMLLKEDLDKGARLIAIKEKYNILKHELFKLSIKIQNTPEKDRRSEGLLKEFLLLLVYLNPALQKTAEKRQNEMSNRKVEITADLIQQIIDKEKEGIQKEEVENALEPVLVT